MRTVIYVACGLVMIVSLGWAVYAGVNGQSITLQEIFAIEAFAISWLAKGEADQIPIRAYRFIRQ